MGDTAFNFEEEEVRGERGGGETERGGEGVGRERGGGRESERGVRREEVGEKESERGGGRL